MSRVVPFVHSGYARIADDNYQTVDGRCLDALVATWPLSGRIVDPCAPQGSGIVDALSAKGFAASGASDAFGVHDTDWIVTNPPYDRKVVDSIAEWCVGHVRQGLCQGAAFLMRANWDFAVSRAKLFEAPFYAGQTRMRFRPWWSKDRTASPIHNFVWHVWLREPPQPEPVVLYWQQP